MQLSEKVTKFKNLYEENQQTEKKVLQNRFRDVYTRLENESKELFVAMKDLAKIDVGMNCLKGLFVQDRLQGYIAQIEPSPVTNDLYLVVSNVKTEANLASLFIGNEGLMPMRNMEPRIATHEAAYLKSHITAFQFVLDHLADIQKEFETCLENQIKLEEARQEELEER